MVRFQRKKCGGWVISEMLTMDTSYLQVTDAKPNDLSNWVRCFIKLTCSAVMLASGEAWSRDSSDIHQELSFGDGLIFSPCMGLSGSGSPTIMHHLGGQRVSFVDSSQASELHLSHWLEPGHVLFPDPFLSLLRRVVTANQWPSLEESVGSIPFKITGLRTQEWGFQEGDLEQCLEGNGC